MTVYNAASSGDSIRLRLTLIDLCGRLEDGVLLGQVLYWFEPDRAGESRLKVQHDGYWWIAKRYEDWYNECRIAARPARAIVARLIKAGLLIKAIYQFAGKPTVHLRPNTDLINAKIALLSDSTSQIEVPLMRPVESNGCDAGSQMDVTPGVKSYTETTTETTTDSCTHAADAEQLVDPAADAARPPEGVSEPETQFGFTAGEAVFWLYEHRGGYGYTKSVPATVLSFTPKKVWIAAQKAKGGTERRCVAPSRLSHTEHRLARLEDLTPEQQVIARRSFQLKPGDGVGKSTAQGINTIISELRARWINGDYPAPDELERAYQWHTSQRLTPSPQPVKVVSMVARYREVVQPAMPSAHTRALDGAWMRARKDCPQCGGNGSYLRGNIEMLCGCTKEGAA